MQHPLSTVYTAYCIIPPLTVSHSQQVSHLSADHVAFNSLHPNNYESTNKSSLSTRRTSLPNYCLQILRLQVLLQSHSIMASRRISKLARSRPPSASQHRLITASMCISKLTQFRHPRLHDHGLAVHLQTHSVTASKWIFKLAPLQPPSSHDHGLQMHLRTRFIPASACISQLARLQPPSDYPISHDYGLEVYLHSHTMMASKGVSILARSRWGERVEIECTQPIIIIPPHFAWHPKGILKTVWSWLKECRKRVRGYEEIPGHDKPHIVCGSTNVWQDYVRNRTNCVDL